MTNINERRIALKILEDIEEKQLFVNEVLDDYFYVYPMEKQQRSFINKLVYGTLENVYLLDYYINAKSKTKTNKMKRPIRLILRMAVYEMLFMDKVPVHATINEAVKTAKKRKFNALTGFINGVLRNIDRERDLIANQVKALEGPDFIQVQYSVNPSLLEYLGAQFTWERLKDYFESVYTEKMTCLRLDTNKSNISSFKENLSDIIGLEEGKLFDYALYVDGYDKVNNLYGYDQGLFVVQDESSMCVAEMVTESLCCKILDACSAPGGKSIHMAQRFGDKTSIISCDISQRKVERINENLERLSINNCETLVQDASIYKPEWESAFSTVILDVPCSGLGVIRSKPDIKLNMNRERIEALLDIQKAILKNNAQYVAINGELIYSTCTINPAENEQQIKKFLQENQNFELVPIDEVINNKKVLEYVHEGMLKLATDTSGTDGFFVAKIRRIQ